MKRGRECEKGSEVHSYSLDALLLSLRSHSLSSSTLLWTPVRLTCVDHINWIPGSLVSLWVQPVWNTNGKHGVGVPFPDPHPMRLQLLPADPFHIACSIQILETTSSPLPFRLGTVMEPQPLPALEWCPPGLSLANSLFSNLPSYPNLCALSVLWKNLDGYNYPSLIRSSRTRLPFLRSVEGTSQDQGLDCCVQKRAIPPCQRERMNPTVYWES